MCYNFSVDIIRESKMDRRSFFISLAKVITIGAAAALGFKSYAKSTVYESFIKKPEQKKDSTEILKIIYKEVKELGARNNEDFIKGEFHIDLDGNHENREEHVVILSHCDGDKEKMIVQVTYFQSGKSSRLIEYAKDVKKILCYIKEDQLEIIKSDYDKCEINSLLLDILKGIREEKKFLKIINRKK